MTFTENQIQLWNRMINLTSDYLESKIEFGYLVKSLEGLLDSGNYPEEITKKWFSNWVLLEMLYAEPVLPISEAQKKDAAVKMKLYLGEEIKKQLNNHVNS